MNEAEPTPQAAAVRAAANPADPPTRTPLQVIHLPNGSFREAFITIPALGREEPAELFQRLYDFLDGHPGWHIARQDVFGVVGDLRTCHPPKSFRLNGTEWPVTWVVEGNGYGNPVAGIQVHAVAGVPVQAVRVGGHTVGTMFEDAAARYCVLGGLRPASASGPRADQARETFDLIETALAQVGMDFSRVFRTWFYLDNILDWYGEFNRVRNEFFQRHKVYDGLVPASTGIGGSNSAGTALVADVLAIEPRDPRVRLEAIPSPLQCPALEYGSSFSRAVELTLPGQRRISISGTASIAPGGATAHVGEVEKQVALTMDVVAAILRSRQMDWADVTRAIGYLKHAEDALAFDLYCTRNRLPPLPVIIAKNDICRDDLLFEIEVDAAKLEPVAAP
jgi:enamine deaminase RidA (YjgF/YER057c/UK114 family)